MSAAASGPALPRFHWIVGIENAFIPDMGVDELSWTGHRNRWREDLALAREAGADSIRYGITWPELAPSPDWEDWRWCDEVIREMERLGLEPIWDLIHFGTPSWLPGVFLDPGFAEAAGRFAGAFARRYRGSVRRYTPLNEPYITTYFRAGWGIWPPHMKGKAGFARLLRPVIDGVRTIIRALKAVDPANEIWLNDGADTFIPARPELAEEARRRTLERYAAFDVLLGKSRPGQETFEWLAREGFPPESLLAEPVDVDVIGLDYYPDTEHELSLGDDGTPILSRSSNPVGIAETMRQYHRRYGRPVFIAESSFEGSDEERRAWIDANLAAVAAVRTEGVPCVGYTWWPLFDHVDWNTLLRELAGHVCPSGLLHLRPERGDREPTDALRHFRERARRGL
jgi:beta-glucosidase/6-phospho-beta-glucosidase/beta-galactosidase